MSARYDFYDGDDERIDQQVYCDWCNKRIGLKSQSGETHVTHRGEFCNERCEDNWIRANG
jgi:hypothetical protein